jgi:hypothetical protein
MLEYFTSRGMPAINHQLPLHCVDQQARNRKQMLNAAQCHRNLPKQHINISTFTSFIHKNAELHGHVVATMRRIAAEYAVPVLYVPYERLVKDEQKTFAAIQDFWGVTQYVQHNVTTTTTTTTTVSL